MDSTKRGTLAEAPKAPRIEAPRHEADPEGTAGGGEGWVGKGVRGLDAEGVEGVVMGMGFPSPAD